MRARCTFVSHRVVQVLLVGLLLSHSAAALGDDADDIAAAIIRDTPNRAEAAKKILDAARSLKDSLAVQIRLCVKAYEQGMAAPGGYATAIAALNLLEKVSPSRAESWRDKRLEAYRLQYYRSGKAAKEANGRLYLKLLLARARAAGKSGNWKEAANHYRQAYTVARTLKLPEKTDIYEDLRTAGSYEMIHNRIEVLRAALAKNPSDPFSRKQITMAYLVDLDRPREAVKYLDPKIDATLHKNVTMAAKEASALADADFFALGLWYRSLSAKAPLKHTKVRMLTRSLDNINRYLEVYSKQDAQRLRATTLVTLIEAELKQLGATVASRASLPAGIMVALSFDKGQWIKGDSGVQIKDVSGKGKPARAISAHPVEGKVGQGAHVKKTGCIDPGAPFTTEPRTYAFWAKADSAEQRTVMLFGAYSSGGRFYLGYDEQRQLGIGLGASRWTNESKGLKLDTAWHHYAMTWDGTKVGLYVDGKLRARKVGRTGTRGPLYFGAASYASSRSRYKSGSSSSRTGPRYGFSGCIDEAAIFSRVLSQAEVQQLVKMGNAGAPLGK